MKNGYTQNVSQIKLYYRNLFGKECEWIRDDVGGASIKVKTAAAAMDNRSCPRKTKREECSDREEDTREKKAEGQKR